MNFNFSEMSDKDLLKLLDSKEKCSIGIGGETGTLNIEDKKVFYKKIPLTPIELELQNRFSTRNLHNLPTF